MNSSAILSPRHLSSETAPPRLTWSKHLSVVGAGALAATTGWCLRRRSNAVHEQEKIFARLAARLAATSYWRTAGLETAMSYRSFQSRIAPHSYEHLAPAIDRVKHGEADVLWPGRCAHFAVSSGTTAGRTKYLPITSDMLGHFRQTGLDSLLYYAARTGSSSVFRGRHLFLGGSTALTPLSETQPHAAFAGDLSGITALNLPGWVEKHLYEPGIQIAQIADWPTKLDAIVRRTASLDITMLAGIPSWVLILAAALRAHAAQGGRNIESVRTLWPHFECLIHGGVPIGPFRSELRAALGPTVNFHEVYPASEGFIAAQDDDDGLGLRLMTNAGIFYEFIPMTAFDDTRLEQLGTHARPLAEVKVGVDYALVMTTPAGLARYVIGDIVRFTSTEPPRLIYVGRTKLQLSAFGEHVIEKEVTDALLAVCQRHGSSIANFHVAPIFADSLTGQKRGCHEWWVELNSGFAPTPTQLALELDVELQRLNDDYEAKRKGAGLEPPVVHLVRPGTFEHWQRSKGKWGGQHKMPRCRSDRSIADALAQTVGSF